MDLDSTHLDYSNIDTFAAGLAPQTPGWKQKGEGCRAFFKEAQRVLAAGMEKGIATIRSCVTPVQRSIRVLRKLAKPEEPALLAKISAPLGQFLEAHPIISSLYLAGKITSLTKTFASLKKMGKRFSKIVHGGNFQRWSAAAKIAYAIAKFKTALGLIFAGLEALDIGDKLGKMGLFTAKSIFTGLLVAQDLIFGVGAVLEGVIAVRMMHNWWKTRQFAIEMMSKENPWYRIDERYSDSEYRLFRDYLKAMDERQIQCWGKRFGVKGKRLHQILLDKMPRAVPNGGDLEQMREIMKLFKGRLEANKKMYLVSALSAVISSIGAVCLLIPLLDPVGELILSALVIAKIARAAFKNIQRYQFEERMGMIDRPGETKERRRMKGSERAIDFCKWQAGWYQEKSIIRRLCSTSETATSSIIKVGEATAAVFSAIATVAGCV